MNLIINSTILAHELRMINKVAPQKAPIPVLSGVRLTADTQLRMYATDLEIGMSTQCPADVQMPGVTVLHAARLLAMVEQFPNADVTIAATGPQIEIKCGAFRSQLQPLPSENFPNLPEVTGQSFTIDAKGLRRLIECTRYAVSDKAGQYFLQGALLTLAGPVTALAATDGKRLALATMPKNGTGDTRVVLPMKALDTLAAQTEGGELTLTIGERHLFFQSGDRLILSRQIEGQFPNYDRIVPRDNQTKVTVDRFALAAALRRVGLASDEANPVVSFTFSSNALDLHASATQVGHAEERIPVEYTGDSLSIQVSWKSILDMLNVSEGLTTTIAIKDSKTPMLLLDGDHHLGVVMPSVG